MNWVLIALIAVAGILNTVQAGSNSTLHKILESPAWSVAAVFGVGLVASLATAVSSGQGNADIGSVETTGEGRGTQSTASDDSADDRSSDAGEPPDPERDLGV